MNCKFSLTVTKEQRTNAIYSIPSNDCDHECIGQTKRQFDTRLKEHQKAVFFCKKENSALLEHTCLTNHTIGWGKSKIITINRRYYRRLWLEAWHINSAHAPLNRDDGGLLPDAYLHFVKNRAADYWAYKRTSCCSFLITPNEGTRQECRNVGSMNCKFSVTFI